jgi:hypothetical protein
MNSYFILSLKERELETWGQYYCEFTNEAIFEKLQFMVKLVIARKKTIKIAERML